MDEMVRLTVDHVRLRGKFVKVDGAIKKALVAALEEAGEEAIRIARSKINNRSGALGKALKYRVEKEKGKKGTFSIVFEVRSNGQNNRTNPAIYWETVERGATIKPKNERRLAWPFDYKRNWPSARSLIEKSKLNPRARQFYPAGGSITGTGPGIIFGHMPGRAGVGMYYTTDELKIKKRPFITPAVKEIAKTLPKKVQENLDLSDI